MIAAAEVCPCLNQRLQIVVVGVVVVVVEADRILLMSFRPFPFLVGSCLEELPSCGLNKDNYRRPLKAPPANPLT